MKVLTTASEAVAAVERWAVIALAVALVGLILLNVVTRSLAMAIYWVDEMAVYCMIWLVFIGASLALRRRRHVRVTAVIVALPRGAAQAVEAVLDAIVFAFCAFMIWMAWIWYDPVTLAGYGFDLDAFAGATFNFIYDEPTTTIGAPKYWVWLVMPLFALTTTLHAAANLADRLAGRAPIERAPAPPPEKETAKGAAKGAMK
ncbi:MAG: TRAP transporter small permease [Marivibrio sp.]|uniref:TRAP transporter small permease n=1 Tax=Marivibrio sp. TaxID=2039719 RepID=UPI0032EC9AC1